MRDEFFCFITVEREDDWEPTPQELLCLRSAERRKNREPEENKRREETNVWECCMNAHTQLETQLKPAAAVSAAKMDRALSSQQPR